jgi:hypothetical protein
LLLIFRTLYSLNVAQRLAWRDESPAQTLPAFGDVLAAAARIAPHAHATPVLRSRRIDALVGAQSHFKAEHLQRAGASSSAARAMRCGR